MYVLMGAIYLYCVIRVLRVKYFFFDGLVFNSLLRKSVDLFLYDNGLRHERVKKVNYVRFLKDSTCNIQYLVKQRR